MPKSKPRKTSSSESDSGPEDRTPLKKSKQAAPKSSGGGDTASRKESDDLSWDLGKNRAIKLTEFKGKWYVDIREFYLADGEMRPGRKGIMLTMEQWQKFKNIMPDLDEAIKKNV